MKKFTIILALLMIFVMTFAVAACRPDDKTNNTNNDQTQENGNNAANSNKKDNNGSSATTTENTVIPEKPDNTSLEFWITQDVSSVDFSKHYEVIGWFGAREFYGKDYRPEEVDGSAVEPEYCVKYLVTAYPDEADGGQYVTQIVITDPNVRVYGLTCKSTFDEFDETMKTLGYTVSKEIDAMHKATLGKVKFMLVSSESENKLIINVEVTNDSGIVY